MQTSFHNTTNLKNEELKEAVARARGSEKAIFEIYFRTRRPFTVSDVHGMCQRAGHNFIKVSAGRAVSNLFNSKDLVKLPETKKSDYSNATEHYYQLNFNKYPSPTNTQQANLFQ